MLGRVGRLLAKVTIATGIFLATGELLARSVNLVDRLNGYNRVLFAPGTSVDLPYRLRPGVTSTLFSTPVRVNSLGLRGPETTIDPVPGTRRVLLVGDSVVYGAGVPEDATLAPALASLLGAAWGRVEVLNGGVPGYDAVADARFLETVGLGFVPERVIVGTSLNDYDVAPQYSPLGILVGKRLEDRAPTAVERSELFLLLRWLAGYLRGGLLFQFEQAARERGAEPAPPPAEVMQGLTNLTRQLHLGFYRAPDAAHWDRLRGAFSDLRRLTAGRGIDLLVAIFPESYQLGGGEEDRIPQQRLLALCREVDVRCLDLLPAFSAAGGDLFGDAQHPNGRGFVVAAQAIAEVELRSGPPGRDQQ